MVQSHWFSVGPIVPWARPGVGAVATQSLVDPAYGPLGLELMAMGKTAEEALTALLAGDADAAVRQVAMVDAEGNVAVHTGKRAIAAAGHQAGAQYSVQANLMDQGSVWPAMANAYENAEGDLAERLLVALEAAEAEGGDLRVEDHPEPVEELRRLVRLARAYHKLNEGDELVTAGDMEAAMDAYRAATEVVPDEATGGEAPFWVGVTLASEGREEEAVRYLQRAQAQNDRLDRTVAAVAGLWSAAGRR